MSSMEITELSVPSYLEFSETEVVYSTSEELPGIEPVTPDPETEWSVH